MSEPVLHAVSPIFQVADLRRGIDFYTRVMGFELGWTWGTPPDRASLCRDAIEITLEVEREPRSSHVYVQVKGIDGYFAKVLAGGATVIHPLANRAYGMRDGRISDPDGNYIALGEALPDAG
jgi:uncharacterized glyoxalase superfamily protein PhnB